jgi:hypothetical protein
MIIFLAANMASRTDLSDAMAAVFADLVNSYDNNVMNEGCTHLPQHR